MTNPTHGVGKKMPSHRVGVYVHFFNHHAPQDPGHLKMKPEMTLGPIPPIIGHIYQKWSLPKGKYPTLFRQPSSQEQDMETQSMSRDR